MLIVMPRASSSGARSMRSNAVKVVPDGSISDSTLVIAAVSVVLPWSTCPMVPMFRCGLARTNSCFIALVLEETAGGFRTVGPPPPSSSGPEGGTGEGSESGAGQLCRGNGERARRNTCERVELSRQEHAMIVTDLRFRCHLVFRHPDQ